jgi:spore maturation protein CgeB
VARILLSAGMNRPWSPGHSLFPALQRTGHEVLLFDCDGAEDPYGELMGEVEAFRPNLHIVYGGARLSPTLIRRIQKEGVFNVLWHPSVFPDPPLEVVEQAKVYDAFFTIAEGRVDRFRAAGVASAEWLPEGMEPSIYEYHTVSQTDREVFRCDIALVGKLESDNPAYMERWKLVRRIVDEGFDIKWWGPRLQRKIGTFVLGLLLSKVSRAYGGRFVWNETYAKAVHLSKIFIARDAYPHIRLSMSSRAFTAMGLGAFYLTFPTDGIEEMFEPDKELVLFRSSDEMVDKIRYYLEHDEERERIAAAAQARVLAEHTYEHRFRHMLEVIQNKGLTLPEAG